MNRGEISEFNPSLLELDPLSRRLTAFHVPDRNARDAAKGAQRMRLQSASEAFDLSVDSLREAMTQSDDVIDAAVEAHLQAQRAEDQTSREYENREGITVKSPGLDILAKAAGLHPEEFVEVLKRELETGRLEAKQAVSDSNELLRDLHPALAGEHEFKD